ncbi:histidine phosphatase family protein [Bacillus tuaregi]|uniref:histidine phosphatase family protein n=1 Tax=Bacillus tuaregi TaxID=1816695 RepID=UPI0008F9135D|nr:phosphoglycerate mutase family protein [Bacillus tuaregi]
MQATFIRHLPTEWNKKAWLQGRRDIAISPLTGKQQEEIQKNQQLLSQLSPFDLVLVSTLKRTNQTARLYGFHAKKEGLLDELDFGEFEGRPKAELMEAYGRLWTETPSKMTLGESVQNLEYRIIRFLDKYKEKENILIFGHGSWIRAIISYAQYGHINNMNKTQVRNNECITLLLDGLRIE